MYKTNTEGQVRYKYVRKNVSQIFILMPIVHLILIFLVYLSVGSKSILGFYLILIWIFGFLIIFFWSTFRQLNRQNRTITEMDAIDENIKIKTEKILWLKAREYNAQKNNLQIKNRKFDWYGAKTGKDGLSIFVDNEELFLVKDYFNDYESIINQLH